jgi:hypothetical protein
MGRAQRLPPRMATNHCGFRSPILSLDEAVSKQSDGHGTPIGSRLDGEVTELPVARSDAEQRRTRDFEIWLAMNTSHITTMRQDRRRTIPNG